MNRSRLEAYSWLITELYWAWANPTAVTFRHKAQARQGPNQMGQPGSGASVFIGQMAWIWTLLLCNCREELGRRKQNKSHHAVSLFEFEIRDRFFESWGLNFKNEFAKEKGHISWSWAGVWLTRHPPSDWDQGGFFSSPAIFSSFFLSFSSFPEKKKFQVRFRTVIKISQAQPLSPSSPYFFFFLLQRFHGKERPVSNLRVFRAEGTPNKLETKLTRGQRHSFHFHTLRKKKHAPPPAPQPLGKL